MVVKDVSVSTESNLIIDKESLKAAGLGQRLQLVIKKGEIRILPEASTALDPAQVLDELAGCLGQEDVDSYDFSLKIGGLNEAR